MKKYLLLLFLPLMVNCGNDDHKDKSSKTNGTEGRRILWGDRKLEWKDLQGPANQSSYHLAAVIMEYSFQYTVVRPTGENPYVKIDVASILRTDKSWRKKGVRSKNLLAHEQLHFDIHEMFAQKIEQHVEEHRYSKRSDSSLRKAIHDFVVEEKWMQMRYDKETNHSSNKKKQKEWELCINSKLRDLK